MPDDDKIYLNGIDAVTGRYLIEPVSCQEIGRLLKSVGATSDNSAADELNRPNEISWLRSVWRRLKEPLMGLPDGVNPANVKQAGWGIVFHENETQAIKEALQPLIDHRKQQLGDDNKIKVLDYRTGESRAKWLARNEVGAGTVDPLKVPYYLLLVGAPVQIPFAFCHQLDVEYGVGLLNFDAVDDYKKYVQSVIQYETGASVPNRKEAIFFATRHPGDRATQLSADCLVNPLAEGGPAVGAEGVPGKMGFRTRKIWGSRATKAALTEVFSPTAGTAPPALLFTASHGIGLPMGHAEQRNAQGAILCQDWPGLGSINSDHYFAAQDVPDDACVHGTIVFCFACFGAGTPAHDRFVHLPGKQPPAMTESPFISALSKKLLSHSHGGALAFIGHVERAWGYSIVTPGAGAQLLPFENALSRLLKGEPLGYAMKDFNEKYAVLSTSLSHMLEQISFGAEVSNVELATSWIERNDAEGYVVIGDPAIQLRISDMQ